MASGRDILTAAPKQVSAAMLPARRRFFRFLKFGLILTMLAVMTLIFMWPDLNKADLPQKTQNAPVPNNELIHPEFSSVDDAAHPYTVTATRATQRQGQQDLIDLEDPSGQITLGPDHQVKVTSKVGFLNQETKSLDLSGGVTIEQNKEAHLKTDAVTIDMKSKTMSSTAPVSAIFPQGSLNAAGMTGTYDQGKLIFKGPAKLILNTSMPQGKILP